MTPVVCHVIHMAGWQCAPITVEARRIQFKDPFGTPSPVFEGNQTTATLEGAFMDIWEKVP
jgi:hypothetical protein